MAGMFYEDLEPGVVVEHAIRRTLTETDNILFSAMTYNCAPLHIDAEYSRNSIYGQRLVNSMFLLALVAGVTVYETTLGTTLGNLGFKEITFPKPVFHGDTVRVRTEVLERRLSKKRSDSGIVTFRHVALNQRDEVVVECTRVGLMLTREGAKAQAPAAQA
jgi:acyl dehydratase